MSIRRTVPISSDGGLYPCVAAPADGVGGRLAAEGTTAGILPAIHHASGFIEFFPEDHS
jgi:hypothetical protein